VFRISKWAPFSSFLPTSNVPTFQRFIFHLSNPNLSLLSPLPFLYLVISDDLDTGLRFFKKCFYYLYGPPFPRFLLEGGDGWGEDAFKQTKTINSSELSNYPECLRARVACLTLNAHLFVHRKFFLIHAYDFVSDLLNLKLL